jgi:UDP-2,3-diacylglucosamine hydrolase
MQFNWLPAITIPTGKKIYFASDFHLGIPSKEKSLTREKLLCKWLDEITPTAHHIFLLGDIFDAWLEYKTVVPKGFVRLLGKLAQLRDSGIAITTFTGNHDLWMYGYFESELDILVLHEPHHVSINGTTFLLGHGDGLGPGDRGYKVLKSLLRNKTLQWLHRWLHPDIGIKLAMYFSGRGLDKKNQEDPFLGADKEYLVQFCNAYVQQNDVTYFIFGHRHQMITHKLNEKSSYINLGDWLRYNSYGVFADDNFSLLTYKN